MCAAFGARSGAHPCLLLSIPLYLELAVAVAAKDDSIVGLHSQLLAASRPLLPLQVLPALGPRERLEDDGDIVLSCLVVERETCNC